MLTHEMEKKKKNESNLTVETSELVGQLSTSF